MEPKSGGLTALEHDDPRSKRNVLPGPIDEVFDQPRERVNGRVLCRGIVPYSGAPEPFLQTGAQLIIVDNEVSCPFTASMPRSQGSMGSRNLVLRQSECRAYRSHSLQTRAQVRVVRSASCVADIVEVS